jgi:hypothetical protein
MWGKGLAVALWLTLAFVTWNVVFDRSVFLAGSQFTRDNVERWQRGDAVPTIETAYRPHVRRAAIRASGWAASVLIIGAVTLVVTSRKTQDHEDHDGHEDHQGREDRFFKS